MTLDALPLDSQELVERLDKLFPARCIQPGESLEDAHRYAGKRDLVEALLYIAARQRDTSNLLTR